MPAPTEPQSWEDMDGSGQSYVPGGQWGIGGWVGGKWCGGNKGEDGTGWQWVDQREGSLDSNRCYI